MELKDIISYTGIEASNFEEFKNKFSEKFVPKGEAIDIEAIKSETVGKAIGPVQTKIKSLFGLTAEETAGLKKWEEILDLAHKKVKSKEDELTELSLRSSDGALKELNDKIEKLNRTKDEYKTAAQQAQEALQAKENEWSGKFKSFKTESILKDSMLKVHPKIAKLSEAEQFHMDSLIKENVIIDFDENDQPIVLNKEGKRWNDPNKAGGFLTADAVIELIATEKNYIKKNDAGERKPVFNTGGSAAASQQNNNRAVHPRAAGGR